MGTRRRLSGVRIKGIGLLAAVLALAGAFLARPAPAQAHCDSVNGPVVNAARAALSTGDVKLILPYVQPESEAELTAAFEQARQVRASGGSAQELADTYFFEAAVRLHRVGEGAAYTGLKYETDFGPALTAADEALESGSIKDVSRLLDQAVSEGVAAKFEAVQEARRHAAQVGTVEAERERAEAELVFEKYVYELHSAATGETAHAEEAAPAAQDTAHETPASVTPADWPYPNTY